MVCRHSLRQLAGPDFVGALAELPKTPQRVDAAVEDVRRVRVGNFLEENVRSRTPHDAASRDLGAKRLGRADRGIAEARTGLAVIGAQ